MEAFANEAVFLERTGASRSLAFTSTCQIDPAGDHQGVLQTDRELFLPFHKLAKLAQQLLRILDSRP